MDDIPTLIKDIIRVIADLKFKLHVLGYQVIYSI